MTADVDELRALRRMLAPRSIAVVGASADPAKRGYQALRALSASGYPYPIYPVNPKGGDLLGIEVLTSIADLPRGVDTALVCLPAAAVPAALRELSRVGVAGAVVLANGFGEAGAAGAANDARLRQAVAELDIRVIGPNTSGILNAPLGADLVGLGQVPAGPVSVVAQSGNMWLSLVADDRATRGPGFHCYVGLGNQVDVRYDECLRWFAHDGVTGAVAVHSEGLQDGRAFLVAAAEATARLPVVMLRGGRTEAGRRTALSHTGSVGGPDAVAVAVLAQAGVELVDRCDELAVVAGALATTSPVRAGRGVVILTDGGGHATLAADALGTAGVDLAPLSPGTQARLRELLGERAAVTNPVDVAGATDDRPALFADCAEALMNDDAVGLVLVVGLFGGYFRRFDARLAHQEEATSRRLLELATRRQVPLVVQSCYATETIPSHDILRDGGVTVLPSIDHAVRVVTALARRGRRLASLGERSLLRLPPPTPGERSPLPPAQAAPGEPNASGKALDEPAARRLVEAAGIETGPWAFAASGEDLAVAVERFGGPCAVKVVSPEVPHKSDAGGVRLDVTADTAANAWRDIVDSVTAAHPAATIAGAVVAPMAEPGVELFVGAARDPIFGPVVAFGSGGILVEALGDVSFRAAPLTRLEAEELISETIASRTLDGFRGLPPVDRKALATLLVRVGEFLVGDPGIAELDLNPVIATRSGLLPVDVRIVRRIEENPA